MTSKDLKEIQRVLKKKGIKPEAVADLWAVNPTHVSKVFNGRRPLTPENHRAFNEKFGHIVKIDPSLIGEDPVSIKDLQATVRALNKNVADLTAILGGLKEFVMLRVVAKDKVPRTRVLSEMGILEEEVRKMVKSGGIPTG